MFELVHCAYFGIYVYARFPFRRSYFVYKYVNASNKKLQFCFTLILCVSAVTLPTYIKLRKKLSVCSPTNLYIVFGLYHISLCDCGLHQY